MKHPNVSYAGKGGPALNDAIIKDAYFTDTQTIANITTNGFNAPSTILQQSSEEFLTIYNSADLIITKGQGTFEGLMSKKDARIFNILIAKCDLITGL